MRWTTRQHRTLNRRTLLRAGAAAGLAGGGAYLANGASGDGRPTLRFLQNKPEAIGYFGQLVKDFNASQTQVRVIHDSTPAPLIPQFVRGTPPDLACYNYNLETADFISRGELNDLGELPEAGRVDPQVQDLVGQFAQHGSATSVLPYSVTAAGVLYNKDLFDEADLSVPRTWSELLDVCETFKRRGVTPLQLTYKETWTIAQGIFDYVTGSALDVAAFFEELKSLGPKAGPGADVSFGKDFREPVEKILRLVEYANRDAASRSYPDGNVAFGRGRAAMYFQGPWAIGEIEKIDPKLRVGTFALPATENPKDTKARVNLDLSLWIPRASSRSDEATEFLSYLTRPKVMNAFNARNLGSSPTRNAPPLADARVAGLQPYLDSGRFYQGAATYIPLAIPLLNYLQELVISRNASSFLSKLDNDWARYALRTR